MDPTPGWTRWRQTDPAVHGELEVLAKSILEAAADAVPVDQLEAIALANSLSLGVVVQKHAAFSFADSALRDAYLARAAHESIGTGWADPQAFADAIANIQYRTAKLGARKQVAHTLFHILFQEGVPLFDHVAALARRPEGDRHGLWSVYSVLCDALPDLDAKASEVATIALLVVHATAGDLMEGSIYGAVEQWAVRSRVRSDDLLQYLKQSNTAALLPASLSALAVHDRAEAHARALEILSETDRAMRSAALLGLACIPYPDSSDTLLHRTVATLDSLLRTSGDEFSDALAQAHFALLKGGVDVSAAIVGLSASPTPTTRHVLARGLFAASARASEDWWNTAFMNLAVSPNVQMRPLKNV